MELAEHGQLDQITQKQIWHPQGFIVRSPGGHESEADDAAFT